MRIPIEEMTEEQEEQVNALVRRAAGALVRVKLSNATETGEANPYKLGDDEFMRALNEWTDARREAQAMLLTELNGPFSVREMIANEAFGQLARCVIELSK